MITRPLFCAALLLAVTGWSGENPIPTPLPADRYTAMSSQSPFALATATAPPPPAPQASFAANWYVSGIARIGDTDFVSIKSRDAALQFSLFGSELNLEQGVSVASVNWSETIGKSTVILQKGTEMAKLEFNEAELRGTPPAPAVPANPGIPQSSLRRPTGITTPVPPALPGGMTAPPVVTPNASLQQFPAGANRPIEIRRRERVIPVPR